MDYKRREKFKNEKPKLERDMLESDDNRLIELAWQDRISFDIIYKQYGLTENQVKKR